MASPNDPIYYAHKRVNKDTGKVSYFHASPNKWWVELHMAPDPIVTLRFRERTETDPPSPYWGWVDARHPDVYSMVWPSRIQLEMCFPSGTEPAEKQGDGHKVNLVVEEIPAGA
jgi:hypothetical protein